ncbi:hypothetical protein BDV32DRAFT_138548 [Aspergillus pseudonomiae]|nr:hypothetical protein BDV32DRAFT_138548 [Aspergillus pseudonomiae]
MDCYFAPSILRPDFTWPRPVRCTISQSTPPVPRIPSKAIRIAWGVLHKALYYLSQWYCSWFDIPFDVNILQLTFGLIMKWTDRTSIEEAIAMQMARATGMPAPRLISCGEHPNAPFNRKISILMTRLPGTPLENSRYQLEICVHPMRLWCPPDQSSICSPIGTSIRSPRVPGHVIGPFISERDFYDYLFSPASSHAFESPAHNILTAGWYPEHWEFTTAMRFRQGCWRFQVASWIGGDQYREELELRPPYCLDTGTDIIKAIIGYKVQGKPE